MYAASLVLEAVDGFAPTLTVRYDDAVRDPEGTQVRVADAFGLASRPDAAWEQALHGSGQSAAASIVPKEAGPDPETEPAPCVPPDVEEIATQRRIRAALKAFGYD